MTPPPQKQFQLDSGQVIGWAILGVYFLVSLAVCLGRFTCDL